MLPERYKMFRRPTVQAVKGQNEHFINVCKIYDRNCVKSRRVRGHIASFKENVRRTPKVRAVQKLTNTRDTITCLLPSKKNKVLQYPC
jgi:hypothetical protein